MAEIHYFASPVGGKELIAHTYGGHSSGNPPYAYAVDITARYTPIYAIEGGIIEECHDNITVEQDASSWGGMGNHIKMRIPAKNWCGKDDSKYDLYVRYMHLSAGSLKVKKNDRVYKGQELAKSGNTGSSTGPHLHIDLAMGNYAPGTGAGKSIKVNTNGSFYQDNKSQNTELYKRIMNLEQDGNVNKEQSYVYWLFCQNSKLIKVDTSSTGGSALTKSDRAPEGYYTRNITQEDIMKGSTRSFAEIISSLGAIAYREMGGSIDQEYTYNGIAIYAKLFRARFLYDSKGTMIHAINTGGFSGSNFSTSWGDVAYAPKEDKVRKEIEDIVMKNLLYPQAYNIITKDTDKYLRIASMAPYFNYGYGNWFSNNPNNEDDIENGIKNGSLPSHISLGNSDKLAGVVGNTAFFPHK